MTRSFVITFDDGSTVTDRTTGLSLVTVQRILKAADAAENQHGRRAVSLTETITGGRFDGRVVSVDLRSVPRLMGRAHISDCVCQALEYEVLYAKLAIAHPEMADLIARARTLIDAEAIGACLDVIEAERI